MNVRVMYVMNRMLLSDTVCPCVVVDSSSVALCHQMKHIGLVFVFDHTNNNISLNRSIRV
jgi:hypothetical protein